MGCAATDDNTGILLDNMKPGKARESGYMMLRMS
jgi:hypothetical protein